LFSFVPRVKRLRPHPRQAKASTSFLKKRSKKLLIPAAVFTLPAGPHIYPLAQDIKVFWFFSSEKNMLSPCATPPSR
jgi:hypothetical protein